MTIELAELEKLARAASKWDGRPSMAEYREADEKFNSLDLADIVLSLISRLEAAEARVRELEGCVHDFVKAASMYGNLAVKRKVLSIAERALKPKEPT